MESSVEGATGNETTITKEQVEMWSNGYNLMRRLYCYDVEIPRQRRMLATMCEQCVLDRANACASCKAKHDEMDATETFLGYKTFERTKQERLRIKQVILQEQIASGELKCSNCGTPFNV
jgi:hypothetical protein